ncbi:MAG: hypothetical protein RLZZ422_1793 [Pseudomonadota bacterium]|jgi:DNA-binding response OmpR family regulator
MIRTILIADDEPNILISLEFLMKREGFRVLVAHNGQEALDQVANEAPDLILLDVMMPKKTGFDVCQELRAQEAYQHLPIIMLTAKGRDTDIAKGKALGASDYILKPFSTKELVQKVRDIVESST